LEARGGAAAYSSIHSFCAKGMIDICREPLGNSPYQYCAVRPNRWRQSIDLELYNGQEYGPYSSGFDGKTAWTAQPGSAPKLIEGKTLEDQQEDAEWFAWLADQAHYRSAEVLGEVSYEHKRCYALKLVTRSGRELMQYYDTATFLLAGAIGTEETEAEPILQRTSFGDYRQFGGFQFPMSISTQRSASTAVEYVLVEFSSVEVNAVKESVVEMPSRPVFGEAKATPSVSPGAYQAMVGRYADGDAVLTVVRVDDRLFAQRGDEGQHELFPASATEFFSKDIDARITFVKDHSGRVTKAIDSRDGDVREAPKLP